MRKFLAVLLLGFSAAYAQVPTVNTGTSGVTAPTGTTVIRTMGDDGHVNVPLQFGFPYFGKTFTNSVMYDNGVVGFLAPATQTTQAIGCDPAITYCGGSSWYSQQFTTTLGPSWNYMIAPLHSDLRPVASTVYSTTGDASQMTYRWQNIGEYYNPSNLSTFSLQIKPSGFIGVDYEKVNLGQSNVSVGLTGDLSKGEFYQHYYKPAGTQINSTSIQPWNVLGTGVDQCAIDPLSSNTCPGYAQAYLNQQCTANALYNPSCPGYASAYFNQQCTANPLYNINCPGYASAYLDYQCSINPLYSTTCQGYEQAYFNQQCSISPLYSQSCSGYATAYHDQQCSINPLYATDCVGYAAAYKAQQCSLNGLYDKTCPNYATAYATKMLLEQQGTASTVATAGVIAANAPQQTTPAPSTDSSGEVKVAVVADSNVNNVITTTATSASPAQAATATVPLVPAGPPPAAPVVEAKVESKQDTKNAPSPSVSPTPTASNSPSDGPKPTARQEIQAKREAAAKAKAVEDGKNLAGNMGKAADMEQQKQIQNVVIQAMGFTPGFDTYNKAMLPDTVGYKPFSVYNNQRNVDNRANLRMFGGTDKLHNEMVDSQYNRGN